jgi:E3 ubiquitin-protein ligase TRIP12
VEDLGLSFILPGYDNIELKLNGKDTDVTVHNLQEYIDLVMHFTFHETIKVQLSAFKKGFNSIFPIESLKPFSTTSELEDMICGTQRNEEEWTNGESLLLCIKTAHGFHHKSDQFLYFIRFITELDFNERRKFLKFITGSPRLPNGGFNSLDPRLTVVMKKPLDPADNPDHILPSVMTCQNYVKLPRYSSFEILKA